MSDTVLGGKHGTHVVPSSLSDKNRVRFSHLRGVLLMVPGVEVHHVFRNLFQLHPIDIVKNGSRFSVRFIGDCDLGFLLERHLPVAVVSPSVRAYLHWQGVNHSPHPVSDRKKVAHRGFHRRHFNSIPVDPQNHSPRITNIHGIGDEPDVDNVARPLKYNGLCFALLQPNRVAVLPPVSRGCAHTSSLLRPSYCF